MNIAFCPAAPRTAAPACLPSGLCSLCCLLPPPPPQLFFHVQPPIYLRLPLSRHPSSTTSSLVQEKNWGGGFPRRWCWIQCNTFEGEPGTSVTAVGALRGLLGVPGVEENVGMIGIHHRGRCGWGQGRRGRPVVAQMRRLEVMCEPDVGCRERCGRLVGKPPVCCCSVLPPPCATHLTSTAAHPHPHVPQVLRVLAQQRQPGLGCGHVGPLAHLRPHRRA